MSFNNIFGVEHARNQELVHRVNTDKGWFDKPVTFLEAMALLGTEISEASEAHDKDGLLGGWQARPQMASELADCYIRFLDDCTRFGLDLGLIIDVYKHTYERRNAHSFDGACMNLYRRLRDIIEAYRIHGLDQADAVEHTDVARPFAHFYLQLQDICDEYGVDLMKAFDAKMAVNAARPYRHGNKFA